MNWPGLPHSAALVSEVATLNQKRSQRIEFEGSFVEASTQRPRVNGLPNDVDGAVKTSAIATNGRLPNGLYTRKWPF